MKSPCFNPWVTHPASNHCFTHSIVQTHYTSLYVTYKPVTHTAILILCFGTDRHMQTGQTKIRVLLFDQGLHYLLLDTTFVLKFQNNNTNVFCCAKFKEFPVLVSPTLAVGALALAFCSSRLDLSNSLFSLSNLTAASQISSLLGLAWKARARILLAAGTSPW